MAIDESAWDGGRAMAECSTASDYDKVCAGTKAGDPSLRSSHALPHHYLAKAPSPNADGVRAALQRFSQTQGLTNSAEARRHLEAHMTSIQASAPAEGASRAPEDLRTHLERDHMIQASVTQGMAMNDLETLHTDLHKGGADHPYSTKEASSTKDELFRAVFPGPEVREVTDGRPVLYGHFTRFNEWTEIHSEDEGHFLERVAPGSFVDSFERVTPKVLLNHGRDPSLGDQILGVPEILREDEVGPYYEVPTFEGIPTLVMSGLRAGAYGASFRFHVDDQDAIRKPGRSEHNPNGLPERTITKASVAEFGPVTFPAYAGATAGIRSITDQFRPRPFDEEVARMALEHPSDLAAVIARALKQSPSATEEKPREEKPPAIPKFRSREEWLEWMSTT